jgi:hypothetical protein
MILCQRQPGKFIVHGNEPVLFHASLAQTLSVPFLSLLGQKPAEKFPERTLSEPEGNWSSFQLANSTPPQSVIDSAIAPFARIMVRHNNAHGRIPTSRGLHTFSINYKKGKPLSAIVQNGSDFSSLSKQAWREEAHRKIL